MSLMTVGRSSDTNSIFSFRINARMRQMISPARLLSSIMSLRIAPTSSKSGGLAAIKRSAACALANIAVSGWFSSCASDAASSPIVETRVIRANCSRSCWRFVSASLRWVISIAEPM